MPVITPFGCDEIDKGILTKKTFNDFAMLHKGVCEFYNIIISTGIDGKHKTSKGVYDTLDSLTHKYELYELDSASAVQLYNDLINKKQQATILFLYS